MVECMREKRNFVENRRWLRLDGPGISTLDADSLNKLPHRDMLYEFGYSSSALSFPRMSV